MSLRAIAEAAGVGVATVHRTLESAGVPNGTPENVTGRDGFPARLRKTRG